MYLIFVNIVDPILQIMKQFLKYVLATITGIVLSTFVLLFLFFLIIIGIIAGASKEKKAQVANNAVLHLNFTEPLIERTPVNPFRRGSMVAQGASWLGDFMPKGFGSHDLIKDIQSAASDPRIRGIFIDADVVPAGIATVEEIRNALLDFKKSGKFIYAYAENLNQGCYYLVSAADKIYVNPNGTMFWKGLSAQVMFYKGALEKLDVQVQVMRHGKFKSFTEPFMYDKMSPANRYQTQAWMGSIWDNIITGIAMQRHLSKDSLNALADQLAIHSPEDAVKFKMIDGAKYRDEVTEELEKKLNLEKNKTIDFISPEDYLTALNKTGTGHDKIAVVYATGNITSGEGDDQSIGSERISQAIRQARKDSNVKAIVLRINSPGGSALASDVIWREALLAQKTKPLYVSMGDVAASGGYYIACAADKIYAQRNTITGSIGVFGLIPNVQKLFANKFGITIDTVNTNKHADAGGIWRPLNPVETDYVQDMIEHIYSDFIAKVAQGRHKTTAEIDSIGQGRVWSGTNAQKIGLVDEIGGLNDAIQGAAKKAGLTKGYRLEYLPKQEDFIKQFTKALGTNFQERIIAAKLGENYTYYNYLNNTVNLKGIQARLPFDVVLY